MAPAYHSSSPACPLESVVGKTPSTRHPAGSPRESERDRGRGRVHLSVFLVDEGNLMTRRVLGCFPSHSSSSIMLVWPCIIVVETEDDEDEDDDDDDDDDDGGGDGSDDEDVGGGEAAGAAQRRMDFLNST